MTRILASSLCSFAILFASAGFLASCSTGVDMPQGKRGTYQSVRLIQRSPGSPAITDATEKQVHGLIQKSLARQFTAKGMTYGKGDSALAVGYMVIYQEPGMTASYDEYFGYGRGTREISDVAHIRGSLDSKRPDFFRQVGIVVDIVDVKSGKLVFRNFAKGDVIQGASASTRAARIDHAIATALFPFFQ
jgi:hypothetical protein